MSGQFRTKPDNLGQKWTLDTAYLDAFTRVASCIYNLDKRVNRRQRNVLHLLFLNFGKKKFSVVLRYIRGGYQVQKRYG
ncbi:hypothetical protein AAH994_08345 [Weeksellaceae bacterium A-14]